MKSLKNNKFYIIFFCFFIFVILSFFVCNYIFNKHENKKLNTNNEAQFMDVSDANNINSVESKFGNDIKITQGYLLNYTRKKSSIWYLSNAYVKNIKTNGDYSNITLKNKDNSKFLNTTIDKDKMDVKIGDEVNFVGTIDLKNGEIQLSKISTEKINYKDVTEIKFEDLVNNIKDIKNNYFIVSGYMVTDGDKYKLFDTKSLYKQNKNSIDYFLINWRNDFNFTGNTNLSVKCLIGDTSKLKSCEIIEN